MMAWPTGKKRSPETIAKMRAAKLGKKHSPETIEKMRGKKRSPETIAKIRAAKLWKLGLTTEAMIADYRLFRKKKFTSAEALAALGVKADA